MKYTEIKIKTTTIGSEILADFLEEITGEGVSIYDKSDLDNISTWDYKEDTLESSFDEEVILNGYVLKENEENVLSLLGEKLGELQALGLDMGSMEITLADSESDKWRDVWKTHFKPIDLGRIVICPEWIDYENTEGKIVVKIDPGLAFGTGEHETTSMVLSLMQNEVFEGKKVIDVGCGSGILGIAARLCGADDVTLIDMDPQAVEASIMNARLNGCEKELNILEGDLLSVTDGKYDVVLANLTADILEILAKDINRCIKDGTVLIMSGILNTKLEGIKAVYTALGFETVSENTKGEWSALLMVKKNG